MWEIGGCGWHDIFKKREERDNLNEIKDPWLDSFLYIRTYEYQAADRKTILHSQHFNKKIKGCLGMFGIKMGEYVQELKLPTRLLVLRTKRKFTVGSYSI